ncbi:MAG: glycosyltransferase [Gemmatimonadota bacterium]
MSSGADVSVVGGPAAALFGAAYLFFLALLLPYGLHRLRLVWLRLRRPPRDVPREWEGELPPVTVQLPVFNEANVVSRLIDAACRLDYPRDRLELQVLDDSDDETVEIAAASVRRWRARGVDVHHIRRGTRSGYKAGALAEGAKRAGGELFLVLDADFLPPPELLRQLLPPFMDPSVGGVQAAWGHLNQAENWLTRAQAILLDAHFAVEQEARFRAGLFFNFNGSAGMWRRSCLEEAGGWQADTLTEDLDLSYRAQLAGWRLAYLDDISVPAELPARLGPLEVQQERWAQGGIQTARKLLPSVWRSGAGPWVKLEATAHLLAHGAHPPTLLLAVCLCGLGYLGASNALLPLSVHVGALAFALSPFVIFYGLAAHLRGCGPVAAACRIAEGLVLGVGLGIPVTFALLRGLARARTPFRRTPKSGNGRVEAGYAGWGGGIVRRYVAPPNRTAVWLRGVLGLGFGGAVANLVTLGLFTAVPFTGLFAAGYVATTRESLRRDFGGRRGRERGAAAGR